MKKTYLLTLLGALVVLSILSLVSVSAIMAVPKAYSNQTANFVTTWNFINATDGVTNPLVANTTFYWNSTGTFTAVTATGHVFNGTDLTATLTIASMGEGMGSLRLIVGNETTLNNTMIDSGRFRVDLTNPSLSISTDLTQIAQKKEIVLTWSSSDGGSGLSSVATTVTSPNTDYCATKTYTDTSASKTLSLADTICPGVYTYSSTATDYSGRSTTSSGTFTVVSDTGGSTTSLTPSQVAQITGKGTSKAPIIIGVIAVSVVLYFVFRRR